jgi:hypothetical protein
LNKDEVSRIAGESPVFWTWDLLILRIFEKEGNVSLEYDDFELAQHERDAFQFWNMMAGSGVMGSRIHEGSRAFYMVFQMSRVNI